MDSFEINKIIAAVLLTVLIIIGIGKFTDALFHVEKPKESAYKIEGIEVASTSASNTGTETKTVEVEGDNEENKEQKEGMTESVVESAEVAGKEKIMEDVRKHALAM